MRHSGWHRRCYTSARDRNAMMNRYSRRWRYLGWGLLLALVSVSAADGRGDRRRPGKMSERASYRASSARGSNAKVDVIVRFRRPPGAAEKMLVTSFGGGVRRELRGSSRWMSLRLPASVVAKLAEHSIVDFVAADEYVTGGMDLSRSASHEAPVDV